MAVSVEQFGKAVTSSQLLTADEVRAAWGAIPAAERPKDGPSFAKLFVAQKKLTEFQAAELLAGRGARLIMGEYAVLAEIGAGGMGQVYKAQHRRMKRTVALKVMSSAAMRDEAAVKRFQREVQAAARLEHPNIVTAYDSGEAGSVKYLVMQFVDGGDLSDLVKKNGPLPVETAVDYVLQAAKGLAFAHAEGVIHRDIKPANLLLDKKGVVKILDMGLARIEGGDDGLTATEQVMGTVDYMSPEQAANTKKADARADIYSLGCTLWFLLTAKKVYENDTMIGRLMAHRDAPLPSLVKTRDDVPWPLEQAFHKMIAKRPQDRFQTMEEVITALEPYAGGSSSGGSRSGSGTSGGTNAELASFMQSIGNSPTNAGSMTKGGAAASHVTPAVGSKTSVAAQFDATAQFDKSEAETDPKSQILPTGSGLASVAAAPSRSVAKKTKRPQRKNVKLIAGGLIGAALLLVAGVIVTVRDKDGNIVAELNVPNGASVEVKPTPAVTTATTGISAAEAQRNRAAAEWCLSTGVGFCDIVLAGNDAFVSTRAQKRTELPREPFYVLRITRDTGGVASLQEVSGLTRLRELHLKNTQLSDAVFRHLSDLPKLETLGLAGTRLTDDSLKSAVNRFKTLTVLDLRGVSGLTDAGLKHLSQLPNLDQVSLTGTSVTSAGVAELRNARPGCTIDWTASTANPQSSGSPDAALKFEGKEQFVSFPTFNCDGNPPLTIEAWVTPLKTGDSFTDVIRIGDDQGSQLALRFGKKDWHFTISGPANPRVGGSAFLPAELGKRVHVAGVWRGDQIQVFVDGLRSAGHSIHHTLRSERPRGALRIGFGDLAGIVEQVRISKTFPYEGSARFDPPPQLTSDGDTLALYRFDEGRGNVAVDLSGHGRDGQIVGAQWVAADGSPLNVTGSAPNADASAGWTSLFNGRDFTGWTMMGFKGWTVAAGGVLVGRTSGNAQGWLMSDAEYDDFELELEYKLGPDSNSGVFFRAWPEGKVNGGDFQEVQFLDDNSPKFSNVNEKSRTGAIFGFAAPTRAVRPPANEWHRLRVAVFKDNARIDINGTQVVATTLAEGKRTRGRLGLQLYPEQVEFRSIRLRELNPDGTPRAPAVAPAPSEVAAGPWIDVLPLIDPALDKFSVPVLTGANDWRIANGELLYTGDSKNGKLLFPITLLGPAMEFEVEFTRLAGSQGFNLDIPAAAGPCPVVFDTNRKARALVGHRGIPLDGDCAIVTGRRTKAALRITRQGTQDHVDVLWDDKSLGTWSGDREAISFPKPEGYRHDQHDGLWVPGPQNFVFHSIRARPLQGGTIELRRAVIGGTSVPTPTPTPTQPSGVLPIFTGFDLAGWTGASGVWKWEAGELVGTLKQKGITFLYGAKPYRDFELEYEVQLQGEGANSGAQFRSTLFDAAAFMMTGPQAEIGGGGKTGYGGLWWQSGPRNGVVSAVPAATFDKLVKPDDYNRMKVRCVGKHVTITLNDTVTTDGDFDIPDEGLLGWQFVSQGPPAGVRFRKIVFRDLSRAAP